MTPEEHHRILDEFNELRRSMHERAEARRAGWQAGRIDLGGIGGCAGIGDPTLRESYLTAARELFDMNRDHLLQVALPILFLQRHALEIALKDSIRTVAHYHHLACSHPGPKPDAPRSHSLKRLLRCLVQWLAPEEGDETFALVEQLVGRFHKLDPRGIYLRYRDDAEPVSFDLGESQRDLEELFKRLFARPHSTEDPLGWITDYQELTHELGVREHLDGEAGAA
jgi:hypothetical protein